MYMSETPYHYLETSDPTWLIFMGIGGYSDGQMDIVFY